MTSAVSKEDIEDELVRAGIKSVYIRQHLMRLVEIYARKYTAPDDPGLPPVRLPDSRGYKYKCRSCGGRKHLDQFPPEKKDNPRAPVSCLECEAK